MNPGVFNTAIPVPAPTPVAINLVRTSLSFEPIKVKSVVPSSIISYGWPTTKLPAVKGVPTTAVPVPVATVLVFLVNIVPTSLDAAPIAIQSVVPEKNISYVPSLDNSSASFNFEP